MLPAATTARASITDVFPSCLAALSGDSNPLQLRAARLAVVVLVDGLGHAQLAERAGHARTLRQAPARRRLHTVFPTTTASALASLTTGVPPAEHGLVGYSVRDPADGEVKSLLSGWDAAMRPEQWQRTDTVFERAARDGVRSWVVGEPRFRDSGFTRAVLRGAAYVGGSRIGDRIDAVRDLVRRRERGLVYCYVPELDKAGHAHGWRSDAWTAALEEFDGELARLVATLDDTTGVVVTADHGMVDVRTRLVLDAAALTDVATVAGEPRCVQLYLRPGADPDAVALRVAADCGDQAVVVTRADAVAGGIFGGAVSDEIAARMGDVWIVPRAGVAVYPADGADGWAMVGQHGGAEPEERTVPLLGFGAFGR